MKIKCPSCSSVLSIADSAAGTVVQCQCGKSLRAPGKAGGTSVPSVTSSVSAASRTATTTASVDTGLFDALSDKDLQPLKQVHRPGVATNPYQSSPSVGGGQSGPYRGELASLGKRFLAALVDQLIYVIAMAIAFVPIFFLAGDTQEPASDTFFITLISAIGLALLVPTIVNAIMITKSGQSIGKKALGIRIVQDPARMLPGFVKGVLVRSFLTALLSLVPFFAIIDIAFIFGEERKCLHDKMASTIVIDA